MMTPTTYQLASLRTVNPELSPRDRLLEAVLGIVGEAGEVYDAHCPRFPRDGVDKRPEELGDLCWYFAQIVDVLQLDPNAFWNYCTVCGDDWNHYRNAIVGSAFDLANNAQKHVYQGHEAKVMFPAMRRLAADVPSAAKSIGYTMPEIWAMNIRKLEARYPNGFTTQASRERTDSGTERK